MLTWAGPGCQGWAECEEGDGEGCSEAGVALGSELMAAAKSLADDQVRAEMMLALRQSKIL
eukprot:1128162-Rhodomonas_salina.5